MLGDRPFAERIGDPHLEDLAVAVHIGGTQPFGYLVEGKRADIRAHVLAGHEAMLGAVGAQAGQDVEGAGIEEMRDLRVDPVVAGEVIDRVERRRRARELRRVDVGIDPVRGLLLRLSGLALRDLDHDQVAALMALADRLQANETRMRAPPRAGTAPALRSGRSGRRRNAGARPSVGSPILELPAGVASKTRYVNLGSQDGQGACGADGTAARSITDMTDKKDKAGASGNRGDQIGV